MYIHTYDYFNNFITAIAINWLSKGVGKSNKFLLQIVFFYLIMRKKSKYFWHLNILHMNET